MNKYLITLTPVDTFFFGGEISFNRDKKELKKGESLSEEEKKMKDFNKSFSSYIVKSNPFPQQTSLLGMLRFLILSNNDTLFDISKNKIRAGLQLDVAEEIGNSSFQLNDNDYSKMDFKKIYSISPCFLQRQTNAGWIDLFHSPFDYCLGKVSLKKGESLLDSKRQYYPDIEGYKAKDGLEKFYLGSEHNLKESDIFVEDPRIGISKNYRGKTEDNAFYKQIFYRFSDEYKENNTIVKHTLRFAFYAMLDYDFVKENYIVSLGGDNSRFILKFQVLKENADSEDLTVDFKDSIPQNSIKKDNFDCYGKVVLLSDAFLKKQDIEKCIFSINNTVSFRFLISTVDTENYYKFSGSKRLIRSDEKYNLYQKGSVFYFDNDTDLNAFEDALKTKTRFYQIGYNYFKTIKQ